MSNILLSTLWKLQNADDSACSVDLLNGAIYEFQNLWNDMKANGYILRLKSKSHRFKSDEYRERDGNALYSYKDLTDQPLFAMYAIQYCSAKRGWNMWKSFAFTSQHFSYVWFQERIDDTPATKTWLYLPCLKLL